VRLLSGAPLPFWNRRPRHFSAGPDVSLPLHFFLSFLQTLRGREEEKELRRTFFFLPFPPQVADYLKKDEESASIFPSLP